MLKSITFEVIGDQQIVCGGCEERIEGLLKRLEGVEKVRAKARNQHVEVLFDTTRLDANTIADRLGTAGYKTKVGNSISDSTK
jgi:copper chaperone CopZ